MAAAATEEKDGTSKSSRENVVGTNEKNEEIDDTKSNVLVRTEGEQSEEETCGPIMTSLVRALVASEDEDLSASATMVSESSDVLVSSIVSVRVF